MCRGLCWNCHDPSVWIPWSFFFFFSVRIVSNFQHFEDWDFWCVLGYLSCSCNRRTPIWTTRFKKKKKKKLAWHYTHEEPSVCCLIRRTLYTEFDIGEVSWRAQSLPKHVYSVHLFLFSFLFWNMYPLAVMSCCFFLIFYKPLKKIIYI